MSIKKKDIVRNSFFVVTSKQSCPLYNVGDKFQVTPLSVLVGDYKPACFQLAERLREIAAQSTEQGHAATPQSQQKKVYECGGCSSGTLSFTFRKDEDFMGLQVKKFRDLDEKLRKRHLDQLYSPLRKLAFFESLDDDALKDLSLLLEQGVITAHNLVIKKGDPGQYLFIVLSGTVNVMDDDGDSIAELGAGEIFGEMSLFSGTPITRSINTLTGTRVAMMSRKNFQYVMKIYPALQLFLLRVFIERIQSMAQDSDQASSMRGELADVKVVDLMQMINSAQKTGGLSLSLKFGTGTVFFKDGEIIKAEFLGLEDKEALFTLLKITSGRFSYSKGLPAELEPLTPIGGFMGLLMEGLQRIDEAEEEGN